MSDVMGREPAFPVIGAPGAPMDYGGMTKREAFALAAMQGMLGNAYWDECEPRTVAMDACAYADALLTELAKDPQP